MSKRILITLLAMVMLISSGCAVTQDTLAKKGIYAEEYSSELLANRIEKAVLAGESSLNICYLGTIEDIEEFVPEVWQHGYVNSRYVSEATVEYDEFRGYVNAHYQLSLVDLDLLADMPRDSGELAVQTIDYEAANYILAQRFDEMYESRDTRARYLVSDDVDIHSLSFCLGNSLTNLERSNYKYNYLLKRGTYNTRQFDDVIEIELNLAYKDDVMALPVLPQAYNDDEIVSTMINIWSDNMCAEAHVLHDYHMDMNDVKYLVYKAVENTVLTPCDAPIEYDYFYMGDHTWVATAVLEYPISEAELTSKRKELENRVKEIADPIMEKYVSDKDRLYAAYRAVMSATQYDHKIADTDSDDYTAEMWINRSAYGALVTGKTVCTGYARAYKALCDYMGLNCTVITGEVSEGHAWNQVELDGKTYYVDCTFADTGGRDHFLMTEDRMLAEGYVEDIVQF